MSTALVVQKKLGADATAQDYIHDFVASDNPRFRGKSKKKRIQMALGAFYSRKALVVKDMNARLDALVKVWDESKHPRQPGGAPGGAGGEFAGVGGGAYGGGSDGEPLHRKKWSDMTHVERQKRSTDIYTRYELEATEGATDEIKRRAQEKIDRWGKMSREGFSQSMESIHEGIRNNRSDPEGPKIKPESQRDFRQEAQNRTAESAQLSAAAQEQRRFSGMLGAGSSATTPEERRAALEEIERVQEATARREFKEDFTERTSTERGGTVESIANIAGRVSRAAYSVNQLASGVTGIQEAKSKGDYVEIARILTTMSHDLRGLKGELSTLPDDAKLLRAQISRNIASAKKTLNRVLIRMGLRDKPPPRPKRKKPTP